MLYMQPPGGWIKGEGDCSSLPFLRFARLYSERSEGCGSGLDSVYEDLPASYYFRQAFISGFDAMLPV